VYLAFSLLSRHGKLTLSNICIKDRLLMSIKRYNALAGIADPSNSFFIIPVAHFPWSEKGREMRQKVNNDAARAEQSV